MPRPPPNRRMQRQRLAGADGTLASWPGPTEETVVRTPFMLLLMLWLTRGAFAVATIEPGAHIDHARPLVFLDEQGVERPVKTPEEWARRRRDILAGMQEAMGPLPSRENLPPLDERVTERVTEKEFVRLKLSID